MIIVRVRVIEIRSKERKGEEEECGREKREKSNNPVPVDRET